MHTPSCSDVYGKCSVTGDRIATMQWWMASDSFMYVWHYLLLCQQQKRETVHQYILTQLLQFSLLINYLFMNFLNYVVPSFHILLTAYFVILQTIH